MERVNICKQRDTICQGQHVDPEYTLTNRGWELSDSHGMGAIVETVTRLDGESDHAFYTRVSRRAGELDRQLGCFQCYN